MHRRLIVAFVVVALVAAVAFQLVVNLLLPLFPALNYLRILPPGILSFLYTRDLSHRGGPQATPFLVLVLGLAAASLLAVITALAFAASRPVEGKYQRSKGPEEPAQSARNPRLQVAPVHRLAAQGSDHCSIGRDERRIRSQAQAFEQRRSISHAAAGGDGHNDSGLLRGL